MTNVEAISQFLSQQLAAAQRTHKHAQQLYAEAEAQVTHAASLIKGSPLPEMHKAHHALCLESHKTATAYLDHAAAELKTAQERLDAHGLILEAEKAAALLADAQQAAGQTPGGEHAATVP